MATESTGDVDPEFERNVAAARELANAVTEVSTSQVADDHTLTVTVGPGNTLTGLELTRQALRHDPATLSDLIVDTTARAAERLQEDLRQKASEAGASDPEAAGLLGGALPPPDTYEEPDDDDGDLEALLDEVEQAMGTGPTQEASSGDTAAEDAPLAALRAMAQNAAELQARYAELYEELRTSTATGSCAGNLVTATVGHDNGLRKLEFAPSVFRHGPTRVAEFVLTAVRQASGALSQQTAERLSEGLTIPLDLRALVEPHLPEEPAPTEGLTPPSDRPPPANPPGGQTKRGEAQ